MLKEHRCQTCDKLLFKGILIDSVIEVKCKSCHTMNTIKSTQFHKYLCGVYPCPHRTPISPDTNHL